MSVRLGVLFVSSLVVGCATAPVRDLNAERIDVAMAPEQGEAPEGISLGQDAPPLAAPWPVTTPAPRQGFGFRRGRMISHTWPGHIPDVTVGEVNIGSPGPTVSPVTVSYGGPHLGLR